MGAWDLATPGNGSGRRQQPQAGAQSRDRPSLGRRRTQTRRYLPARGSGGHPCSGGPRAAFRLRAPRLAAAGRAARAPAGCRQLPQPMRGRRRLRRRPGWADRARHESDWSRASDQCAPRPARAARAPRPRPPRRGRTRPGRQSPRPPRPAAGAPTLRLDGGGRGFKDTLTPTRSDRHPGAAIPGAPGTAGSSSLGALPPSARHRPRRGKLWGGGDCPGSQFLFPCH